MTLVDMVNNIVTLENKLIQFNPNFRARINIVINNKNYWYMGHSLEYIENDITEKYVTVFLRELERTDFTITLSNSHAYETKNLESFGESYQVALQLEIE